MIEQLIKVGDPCPFPTLAELKQNGTKAVQGVACSDETIETTHYTFLPFLPNGIAAVNAAGRDVVSYPFTGCWMAKYSDGGADWVCHVSTGAASGDCNAEWKAFKKAHVPAVEFKPFSLWDNTKLVLPGIKGVYGLITADNKAYSILVHPTKGTILGIRKFGEKHWSLFKKVFK